MAGVVGQIGNSRTTPKARDPLLFAQSIDGCSLHAAVRCAADVRLALEQLCRYVTRPALANERVQISAAGKVVLRLKTAWRDGTMHLVMSPLELIQRLAAPVTCLHPATSASCSGR